MKVALSTHFDLSHPVMYMRLNPAGLHGLVDNFAGVFVSYNASRETGVELYLTNYEEIDYDGAIEVAKTLPKEIFVIVVDTVTEVRKDAYIGNVYGLDVKPFISRFADQIEFRSEHFEETEDETFIFGQKSNLKTLYFGVPIPKTYHDLDNMISMEAMNKASELLRELINWIKDIKD